MTTVLAAFSFWTAGAQAGKLLVVSKTEQKVAWYDAESGKLLGDAPTGKGPGQLAVTPDGRTAFVSDFEDIDNTVSVYDVSMMKLADKIKIPRVWGPHGMDITRDGRFLYVTCEKSGAIAVIDVAKREVVRNIKTSMKGAHMLRLSPDDKALYVANLYAGNVSIFHAETGELDRHLFAGQRPEAMDVSPDGKELWVADLTDRGLHVIDLEAREVAEKLECTGTPARLRFSPDGAHVFVTRTQANRVRVFDARTRKDIADIETGKKPHAIAMDAAGNRVFISNGHSNTVSVINLETLELEREFPVMKLPVALAYLP
jgi:YVTN family beta-propeller protein